MFGSTDAADKVWWIRWLWLNLTFTFEGKIQGEEGVNNQKYETVLFSYNQFIYIDEGEGKLEWSLKCIHSSASHHTNTQ